MFSVSPLQSNCPQGANPGALPLYMTRPPPPPPPPPSQIPLPLSAAGQTGKCRRLGRPGAARGGAGVHRGSQTSQVGRRAPDPGPRRHLGAIERVGGALRCVGPRSGEEHIEERLGHNDDDDDDVLPAGALTSAVPWLGRTRDNRHVSGVLRLTGQVDRSADLVWPQPADR